MVNRGVIKEAAVARADDSALEKMASALGASKDTVEIRVGGKSTYTADRGKKLGWKPQYPPEHILDDAENEVELILQTMQARKTTA
ncbi:hypothetical protein C1H76_3373 [Elsinoe australis]|uniref:Uncharacterized protein n=1 Tax=Elsinoe australis TaxID=40998 RepID=A0A4U7B4B6_9PEZI|nr:hypothetical protein C1H76_3373 [Elsinoe australis]